MCTQLHISPKRLQFTAARMVSTPSDNALRKSTAACLLFCIPRSLFTSERPCMGRAENDNDLNVLDGKCDFPHRTSLQQLHQKSHSLSLTSFSVSKPRNNSVRTSPYVCLTVSLSSNLCTPNWFNWYLWTKLFVLSSLRYLPTLQGKTSALTRSPRRLCESLHVPPF